MRDAPRPRRRQGRAGSVRGQAAAAAPTPAAARRLEVELKYEPRTVAAGERVLLAHELAGLTGLSGTRATQIEDRYLDTADGALDRAGFAARLRTSTLGTIVSIKSTARSDGTGPERREELEGPADRTARPRDWPPSEARAVILELCGDAPLIELVTVRQLRRRRLVGDGTTILELSLDEVDVVARSQVVDRWVELEIELVRGDESRLGQVRTALEGDAELVPATASKLERALGAVRSRVHRRPPATQPAARSGAAPPPTTGGIRTSRTARPRT